MADEKNGKKEDLTPSPTQAQLDGEAGEAAKKEKAEKEKAAPHKKEEDLTPTPTQEENDKIKTALFPATAEAEKEHREKTAKAKADTKSAPEDLTPTPTQAELDATKKEIMYEPEDSPGGSTDPQKAQTQRRTVEAKPPAGGYQTRATVAAEPAKTE